jgi:hypothetical protein
VHRVTKMQCLYSQNFLIIELFAQATRQREDVHTLLVVDFNQKRSCWSLGRLALVATVVHGPPLYTDPLTPPSTFCDEKAGIVFMASGVVRWKLLSSHFARVFKAAFFVTQGGLAVSTLSNGKERPRRFCTC